VPHGNCVLSNRQHQHQHQQCSSPRSKEHMSQIIDAQVALLCRHSWSTEQVVAEPLYQCLTCGRRAALQGEPCVAAGLRAPCSHVVASAALRRQSAAAPASRPCIEVGDAGSGCFACCHTPIETSEVRGRRPAAAANQQPHLWEGCKLRHTAGCAKGVV
jgi:hypothetical protein